MQGAERDELCPASLELGKTRGVIKGKRVVARDPDAARGFHIPVRSRHIVERRRAARQFQDARDVKSRLNLHADGAHRLRRLVLLHGR